MDLCMLQAASRPSDLCLRDPGTSGVHVVQTLQLDRPEIGFSGCREGGELQGGDTVHRRAADEEAARPWWTAAIRSDVLRYVDDGIDALMKILENKNGCCQNQIINIGNPDNECSIKELATLLKRIFMAHPKHKGDKVFSEIVEASSDSYYGKGYQDIYTRKPNIEKARKLLGWTPKIGLEESLKNTLDAFLEENEDAVGGNE